MKKQFGFKKLPLAIALATSAVTANAVQFEFGDLQVQVDNTITYGLATRLEDPDKAFYSKYGLRGTGDGTASTYNYDDGNLNFEKGDLISNNLKWSGDFDFSMGNYGAFFRARAFYDQVLVDNDLAYKELPDASIDSAGNGWDLLDAYAWWNFDIGDVPASLRVGRQVVSWGESTFIQGGINSINPLDASAFRKPGAEIKDALLPVNMVYASFGLTEALSMELFYQLQWEKTRPDACGTFFSNVDFVSDGCGPVILGGATGELNILDTRNDQIANGVPLSDRAIGPVTERLEDKKASNEGQYGAAFRYYSEELGDTEFGLYYMNIHSRLPYISGLPSNPIADTDNDPTTPNVVTNPNNYASAYAQYQIEFAEDIQIMGLSFNRTTDFGTSIGGEISFKQDVPVQHNAFELILGATLSPASKLLVQRINESEAVQAAFAAASLPTSYDPRSATGPTQLAIAKGVLAGENFEGYDRFDIVQAQMTFIHFFDQVLGASRLSLAAEIGATMIQDLPELDEARYGRSGIFGIGSFDPIATGAGSFYTCDASETGSVGAGIDGNNGTNETPANCTNEGYVDEVSAGIRIRGGLEYPNAFLGLTVKPNFAFAYDSGNGPEPGAQFIDGRTDLSVGVNFDYLNQLQFGLTYQSFQGGDYNVMTDRDNLAFSLSYAF